MEKKADKNTFLEDLLEHIGKMPQPTAHRNSATTRRLYQRGLDTINIYKGRPNSITQGLDIFQATESNAYASAGIAYTLVIISSENDSTNEIGLTEAMKWLEKAQEWEPNSTEINFIEALVYTHSNQYKNARLVLDHIAWEDPNNYYLALAEAEYYKKRLNNDQFFHWLEKANKVANTAARKAFIFNSAAHFFLRENDFQRAIKNFYQVTKIDPDDAWAWHSISWMFVQMEKYEDARLCNQRALSIMDFDAAREIEAQLGQKKKRGFGRFFKANSNR
ncbi:MAG: hypothetical protein GY805_14500 [Chloroflexi bacterium]|nr:hypothetical protein [Chloroflexota bacterium]